MSKSQHIIIVGCGRLGGILANQLSSAGHRVVIVDQRAGAFDKLSADFSGFKIQGDATEQRILREAGIEKTDCLFAATTEDNTNLMVAQIAQVEFQVRTVMARVYDPRREAIYAEFGIETISPTKLSAQAFLDVITGKHALHDTGHDTT